MTSALAASVLLPFLLLPLAGCGPDGGAPVANPASPAGTASEPPGLVAAGFIASIDREEGFVTIEARGTDGAREGEFVAVFRDERPIAQLQIFEVSGDTARAKVLGGLGEIELDAPVRKPRKVSGPGWPFAPKR